jgi:hypothetical protein
VGGRAPRFEDPVNFPWTMGFAPNLRTEIRVYARFIPDNYPNAKVGLLYQNDESVKDYLAGLREALGAKASEMLVSDRGRRRTSHGRPVRRPAASTLAQKAVCLACIAMAAPTIGAMKHMTRLFCFTAPRGATRWPALPLAFAMGREPGFAVG